MVEFHISIIIIAVFIYAVDNSHNNKIFMKMTATPCLLPSFYYLCIVFFINTLFVAL